MRIFQLLICFGLISFLLFTSCKKKTDQISYDLILMNGKIWTGDNEKPWASWIAINNDKIVLVGSETDPVPDSKSNIDLQGRLTMPGFNDSHVHFAQAGALLLGINLLDVSDSDLFVERVKETTERLPKGSWITRGDWGAYEAWGMGSEGGDTKEAAWEPYRELIDNITIDYPLLVTRYDRKVGLANAVALDYFGIDSESGILIGNILEEALASVPEKSFERKVAEAERALDECRKWGVTTVQDMSPNDQTLIYKHLLEKGKLTTRINFSPSRLSEYTMMIDEGWTIDYADPDNPETAGDDWISFGTLKTHIDGIMGGRTARFY
ncbi:MAG: amidohydrolase family protein, partial [Saprospiraceae bacterium]|nr:amidohydrolase family protein [Saprospiraceae bacterium]